MIDRILRVREVAASCGHSRATVYERINKGLFPAPIAMGRRMSGWRQSEVEAVINARVRGDSDDEIRALVAKLVTARKAAA